MNYSALLNKAIPASLFLLVLLALGSAVVIAQGQHEDPPSVDESFRELLATTVQSVQSIFAQGAPKTAEMNALAHRHVLRLLRSATEMMLEYADADPPVMHRVYDLSQGYALDNPDTTYHQFRVQPGVAYRLRARGPATGKGPKFISLSSLVHENAGLPRIDAELNNANGSLQLNADGGFEAIVGAVTQEHQAPNLLAISPSFPNQIIFLRQVFENWQDESPLRLELEPLTVSRPRSTPGAERTVRAFEEMRRFIQYQSTRWVRNTQEAKRQGVNRLPAPVERPDIAGLTGQRYSTGFYRVESDKALLLSFKPPQHCAYWGVQLASWFGESLDYAHRPVSLNRAQTYLDSSGIARVVIAANDPGVSNWLDVGGCESCREGLLILRFTGCKQNTDIEQPQLRTLAENEVLSTLPADHPRVSPAERQQRQRARRQHLQRRYGQ